MRDAFMRALIEQESGGDPNAQNARTGAFGIGQIMPENWSSWAGAHIGDPNAPQTPENQQRVVQGKLGEYFNKYQDPRLVAAAWYAGPGYADSMVEGKPLFDPNAKQGNGDEPSVNEYISQVVGRMPPSGIAGAGAVNSNAAMRNPNATMPSRPIVAGGTDINAAFQQFLGEYNKPKQFDQSMLSQMEEAMKPTNHRKQAMDAFLESMIGMAKAGAKLDHPEALKEVMGSMQYMNQMNMGYAEQTEKEEQQQKRMKIGMSALQKYGQPGADKSAYGTLFQMATGQRMFEDPDRLSPKDLLSVTTQVASANRANAYYDMATQRMANDERRMQLAERKQVELEKAGTQKQQPTLDDRVKFFKYLEAKAASYPEKDPRREQYLKSGGFQQDVRLAQQMGIDPSEVALLFGGTLKPRA